MGSNWIIESQPWNMASTGSAVRFELFKNDTGAFRVVGSYVSATMQQHRFNEQLNSPNPPGFGPQKYRFILYGGRPSKSSCRFEGLRVVRWLCQRGRALDMCLCCISCACAVNGCLIWTAGRQTFRPGCPHQRSAQKRYRNPEAAHGIAS